MPMKFVDFQGVSKIEKLEPAVVTINKGRTQVLDQVRPMWLGMLNEVRTYALTHKSRVSAEINGELVAH